MRKLDDGKTSAKQVVMKQTLNCLERDQYQLNPKANFNLQTYVQVLNLPNCTLPRRLLALLGVYILWQPGSTKK